MSDIIERIAEAISGAGCVADPSVPMEEVARRVAEPISEALNPYGGKPLAVALDKIILRDAVNFANGRDAGLSGGFNGGLDYTVLYIINAVREALGFEKV